LLLPTKTPALRLWSCPWQPLGRCDKHHASFELCLNGAYADWLQKQAELLVNQDPRAKSLDDTAVATWTAAILEDCRKKGAAEADSINHFGRYMARWREHVFDLATSIRLRGQSD
jgi:hypothetical protein